MRMTTVVRLFACFAAFAVSSGSPALAQGTGNPFVTPIAATEGVVTVNFTEFAVIPDAGTEAARVNLLVDEPGTRRSLGHPVPRRSTS